MGGGLLGGFGNGTKGIQDAQTQSLIGELEKSGVNITKEDIIFVAKDATGQTVWLENGNGSAGLKHILDGNGKSPGHAADFERAFGISRNQIPSFLNDVVSNGRIISNELKRINGRDGFERIYYYDGKHYVLTGIGTNGFRVTAYPIEYGG